MQLDLPGYVALLILQEDHMLCHKPAWNVDDTPKILCRNTPENTNCSHGSQFMAKVFKN